MGEAAEEGGKCGSYIAVRQLGWRMGAFALSSPTPRSGSRLGKDSVELTNPSETLGAERGEKLLLTATLYNNKGRPAGTRRR